MLNFLTGQEEEDLDPLTGMPKQKQFSPDMLMVGNAGGPPKPPMPPKPMVDPRDEIPLDLQADDPGMNPDIKEYVAKKFNLGKYSDENRLKVNDGESGVMNGLATALAGVSAGFQGGNSMAAVQNSLAGQEKVRQGRLDQFDKGRSNFLQEDGLNRQEADRDPMSPDSIAYQEQIGGLFPGIKGVIAGKSKAQIQDMMPLLTAKIKGDQERDNARIAAGTKTSGLSEGEKAVDKDYAKDYTKYTSTGRTNAINAIEKLEQLQKEVASDTGFGEAGGTRLPIPDMARSRLAVERRDNARNFANKTLKELFGGQLSDGDRISAANEYWNDAQDNKSNAKRLEGKIKELRDNVKAQDAQASHFQNNRSLRGFKFTPSDVDGGGEQTKVVGGVTYRKVPGGWEEVTSTAQR